MTNQPNLLSMKRVDGILYKNVCKELGATSSVFYRVCTPVRETVTDEVQARLFMLSREEEAQLRHNFVYMLMWARYASVMVTR